MIDDKKALEALGKVDKKGEDTGGKLGKIAGAGIKVGAAIGAGAVAGAGALLGLADNAAGTADRIDKLPDGSVTIIDYNTGTLPSNKEINLVYEPQFLLLALIMEAGGFNDFGPLRVSDLSYWGLKGGRADETVKPIEGDIAARMRRAAPQASVRPLWPGGHALSTPGEVAARATPLVGAEPAQPVNYALRSHRLTDSMPARFHRFISCAAGVSRG